MTLRVIAVNGMGDSEPSDEHFGMPQEESLQITDTVVNGNQLTITYERARWMAVQSRAWSHSGRW